MCRYQKHIVCGWKKEWKNKDDQLYLNKTGKMFVTYK